MTCRSLLWLILVARSPSRPFAGGNHRSCSPQCGLVAIPPRGETAFGTSVLKSPHTGSSFEAL